MFIEMMTDKMNKDYALKKLRDVRYVNFDNEETARFYASVAIDMFRDDLEMNGYKLDYEVYQTATISLETGKRGTCWKARIFDNKGEII